MTALTDEAAKERASEMEKNKGNEAFKSGDFEESINYYTNSIEIHPTAATYNNRGLASKCSLNVNLKMFLNLA